MNSLTRQGQLFNHVKILALLTLTTALSACGNNSGAALSTTSSINSTSVSATEPNQANLGANSTLPAITVSGNQVLFGGKADSIVGPSLFWSNDGWGGEKYYTRDVVRWVKQDWNATVIRAPMGVGEGGGYISSPKSNTAKIVEVVEAAINNDIYVIIDWHSHDAENFRPQAIQFFSDMARRYGEHNHIIYEIYNEPLNSTSWDDTVKPYAEAVIAAIRAIDPDNLIIVGTPTWSQDVDIASLNPITGYNNIAYALHFYAGSHKQSLRDKATTALNNGIALFVTEWGSVNANGDGAVDIDETLSWMEFLKAHKISHVNWALNDKKEGASALTPSASVSGNWSAENLTHSGQFVKRIIKSH
jgi:aryl-phospho-beta-D-glucosidase BglC (GH1 family)